MTKIRTISGSTYAGRNGCAAARWVRDIGVLCTDTEFDLVDLVWGEVS